MATKDEVQQSLLDAIDAVARKAVNTNQAQALQSAGECVGHLAEAWHKLQNGRAG